MKTLIHHLEELGVSIARIVEEPIRDDTGNILAWNFFVQDLNNFSLAGGTNQNREIAKRIAIAEAFERALANKISKEGVLAQEFLLDKFPTSCGFACGFDSPSTRMRALRESVERWAWSMWIDKGFNIPRVDLCNFSVDSFVRHIFSKFKNVQIFKKDEILIKNGFEKKEYSFLVLLLETPRGVFAGCRAGVGNDDLLSHAAVEGFRNYRNYHYLLNNPATKNSSVVERRNTYFANNKEVALNQISRATERVWPAGAVEILNEFNTGMAGIYLWRGLLKNYVGWHLGDETRFVY